jgi:hypothetical protein
MTPALYQPGDAALDVAANVLAGGKNSGVQAARL